MESGQLSVEREDCTDIISAGQVYGLLTFLTNTSRMSTLKATKPSTVYVLTEKRIAQLRKNDQEAYQLLTSAALNYSARYLSKFG